MQTSFALPDSTTTLDRPVKDIVFLWATPRSVSTAFERVMKNSDELQILHEPFTDTYYYSEVRRSSRYGDWDNDPALASPDNVNALLRKTSSRGRVFVKELAFQGEPYVSDFIYNTAHHIFIIRSPHNVYRSLVKLKPDFTEEEFGFLALERVYSRVVGLAPKHLVVDGDQFVQEPEHTIEETCDEIGVRFHTSMLSWDDGRIRAWSTSEAESQAKWHKTLENSTTIQPTQQSHEAVEVAHEHKEWVDRAIAIYARLTTR
ncbi:sulfotransferase family protein [Sulfitobacter sp. NAS-14.1]|jgi:hypothetical protein|uniref:sulfotransferase-like domain-containing protein n=1 Tax=Sulfitobacter TaxID=60136 RepID=UPI0003250D9A|nr:sulfotransferase family protein [Sulfitobacter sp. NAS-14.1]|tara:strand:+ start:2783 stop:3562 length:780 start_codon:yes stop_codon:yes gene_type:complete